MTILENSLAATVLILAIVPVRAACLHRLPKNTFCVLWTAAALRLLLPFSPASRFSVFTFLQSLLPKREGGAFSLFITAIRQEEVPAELEAAASFPVLEALWLAGFCVMAGVFLAGYVRSMRKFRRSAPADGHIDPLVLERLCPARVRQAEGIGGPLVYGLLRPVILLPEDTDWGDRDKLSFVFAHEYAHIRRRDCLVKLLFVTALCVHWFNPAVWLLCWLANRDIELACDEQTIRTLGEASRFDYARTLLSQAESASGFFPLFSHFGTHAAEERVMAALKRRRQSAVSVLLACLIVAGTLTVFGTSAKAEDPAEAGLSGPALQAESLGRRFLADGPVFGDGLRGVHGYFSVGGTDAEELRIGIPLTTLDGEPYDLKPGEVFIFELRDRYVETGCVWGTVSTMDMETGEGQYVQNEYGQRLLLRTDFDLLSLDPVTIRLGNEQFVLEDIVL